MDSLNGPSKVTAWENRKKRRDEAAQELLQPLSTPPAPMLQALPRPKMEAKDSKITHDSAQVQGITELLRDLDKSLEDGSEMGERQKAWAKFNKPSSATSTAATNGFPQYHHDSNDSGEDEQTRVSKVSNDVPSVLRPSAGPLAYDTSPQGNGGGMEGNGSDMKSKRGGRFQDMEDFTGSGHGGGDVPEETGCGDLGRGDGIEWPRDSLDTVSSEEKARGHPPAKCTPNTDQRKLTQSSVQDRSSLMESFNWDRRRSQSETSNNSRGVSSTTSVYTTNSTSSKKSSWTLSGMRRSSSSLSQRPNAILEDDGPPVPPLPLFALQNNASIAQSSSQSSMTSQPSPHPPKTAPLPQLPFSPRASESVGDLRSTSASFISSPRRYRIGGSLSATPARFAPKSEEERDWQERKRWAKESNKLAKVAEKRYEEAGLVPPKKKRFYSPIMAFSGAAKSSPRDVSMESSSLKSSIYSPTSPHQTPMSPRRQLDKFRSNAQTVVGLGIDVPGTKAWNAEDAAKWGTEVPDVKARDSTPSLKQTEETEHTSTLAPHVATRDFAVTPRKTSSTYSRSINVDDAGPAAGSLHEVDFERPPSQDYFGLTIEKDSEAHEDRHDSVVTPFMPPFETLEDLEKHKQEIRVEMARADDTFSYVSSENPELDDVDSAHGAEGLAEDQTFDETLQLAKIDTDGQVTDEEAENDAADERSLHTLERAYAVEEIEPVSSAGSLPDVALDWIAPLNFEYRKSQLNSMTLLSPEVDDYIFESTTKIPLPDSSSLLDSSSLPDTSPLPDDTPRQDSPTLGVTHNTFFGTMPPIEEEEEEEVDDRMLRALTCDGNARRLATVSRGTAMLMEQPSKASLRPIVAMASPKPSSMELEVSPSSGAPTTPCKFSKEEIMHFVNCARVEKGLKFDLDTGHLRTPSSNGPIVIAGRHPSYRDSFTLDGIPSVTTPPHSAPVTQMSFSARDSSLTMEGPRSAPLEREFVPAPLLATPCTPPGVSPKKKGRFPVVPRELGASAEQYGYQLVRKAVPSPMNKGKGKMSSISLDSMAFKDACQQGEPVVEKSIDDEIARWSSSAGSRKTTNTSSEASTKSEESPSLGASRRKNVKAGNVAKMKQFFEDA